MPSFNESIKSSNFPILEGLYPDKDYELSQIVVSTFGGVPEEILFDENNLVTLGLVDLFEDNQFYYVCAYHIYSDNSVHWEYSPIVLDDSTLSSENGVISFRIVSYMFSTFMFSFSVSVFTDGIVQIDDLGVINNWEGSYILNDSVEMSPYILMKHFLLYAIDNGLSYGVEGGSSSCDVSALFADIQLLHTNSIEAIRQNINTSIQGLENALIYQMNLDKNQLISELSNLNISLPENIDFTESLNGTFGSLKDGTRVQILLEDGLTYSSTIYEILRSSMVFADDKLYVVLYTLQDETNGSITLNTIDRMKLYVEPESEG